MVVDAAAAAHPNEEQSNERINSQFSRCNTTHSHLSFAQNKISRMQRRSAQPSHALCEMDCHQYKLLLLFLARDQRLAFTAIATGYINPAHWQLLNDSNLIRNRHDQIPRDQMKDVAIFWQRWWFPNLLANDKREGCRKLIVFHS